MSSASPHGSCGRHPRPARRFPRARGHPGGSRKRDPATGQSERWESLREGVQEGGWRRESCRRRRKFEAREGLRMNGALVSRRRVALVPYALAVVALVAALGVALFAAAPAGAQDGVQIDIVDFTFDPGSVEVVAGTTV